MAIEDWISDWCPEEDEIDYIEKRKVREFIMPKNVKKSKRKKPILIKVGKHLIDPNSVRCITQVRHDLYIVKFHDDPNPEYACWVEKNQISSLLNEFDIKVND